MELQNVAIMGGAFLALAVVRHTVLGMTPSAWPLKRRLRTANAVASTLHAALSAFDALYIVRSCGDDPHAALGGAYPPTWPAPTTTATAATAFAGGVAPAAVGAGSLEWRLKLHTLLELTWYIFDTMDEIIQIRAAAKVKTDNEDVLCGDLIAASANTKRRGPSILQAGFLLHHVPPVAAFTLYLLAWDSENHQRNRGIVGYLVCMCFLSNFSTPFQNFRVLMRDAGMHQSHPILYRANFVAFFASFTLLRLIGLPYLLRAVVWVRGLPTSTSMLEVLATHIPRKCLAGTVVLAGINWYWWAVNARKLVAVLLGKAS